MKRLREVIVRTGVESGDAIVNRVTRREHEDRNRVVRRPQLAAHLEAALHRQQQIEDHHVVRRTRAHLNSRHAVYGDVDRVSVLAQALRHQPGGRAFVFDQQDAHSVTIDCRVGPIGGERVVRK